MATLSKNVIDTLESGRFTVSDDGNVLLDEKGAVLAVKSRDEEGSPVYIPTTAGGEVDASLCIRIRRVGDYCICIEW